MILAQWEHRARYGAMHALFSEGFAFLEKYLEKPAVPGSYEISGTELFARVLNYETHREGFYETHDQYIDIQYMVSGTEKVFCCDREGLKPRGVYDAAEDLQFYEDGAEGAEFLLTPGSFAIFFPEDAHKGGIAPEEPAEVEKVVLKVRV